MKSAYMSGGEVEKKTWESDVKLHVEIQINKVLLLIVIIHLFKSNKHVNNYSSVFIIFNFLWT